MFCFSFLLSVAFQSIYDSHFDKFYLYLIFFVLLFLLVIFWQNKKTRFVLLCCLFFSLGIWRYLVTIPNNNQNNLLFYLGENKIVEAVVSAEPDIRLDGVRYILSVENIYDQNNKNFFINKTEVKGKVYLKHSLYPRYNYGDKLKVACTLQKPEPVESFRYDKYLARYDVFVVCMPSSIERIAINQGKWFFSKIFAFKSSIASKINIIWHEPYASFMAGLLYGYRGGLGELNELFSRTGVTHIVAISGYNITIVSSILISLCTYLYIPRKKAFYLIVFGIITFVIFAGASASVVRAGIMGIIVLLTKQIGRKAHIANVLILTAFIMALQNPYVLIWDAGFQLSFISTLGLVYLSPILERKFQKIPEFFGIKASLLTTISAIVATLPLILYQFNRLSIVAPVVNILILWILPWIMFSGFFVLVFSFIFAPVAEVLSWLSFVAMKYIVVVVTFFSNLHFATIDLSIPLWLMITLYLLLVFYIKKFDKKIIKR
ncbi:MAG: ComEC/Rec2 family competence protein [Candidatus Magasanikbacteria bacterium]